jgi:hypothetical protein
MDILLKIPDLFPQHLLSIYSGMGECSNDRKNECPFVRLVNRLLIRAFIGHNCWLSSNIALGINIKLFQCENVYRNMVALIDWLVKQGKRHSHGFH